jgi:hypothetical protein
MLGSVVPQGKIRERAQQGHTKHGNASYGPLLPHVVMAGFGWRSASGHPMVRQFLRNDAVEEPPTIDRLDHGQATDVVERTVRPVRRFCALPDSSNAAGKRSQDLQL